MEGPEEDCQTGSSAFIVSAPVFPYEQSPCVFPWLNSVVRLWTFCSFPLMLYVTGRAPTLPGQGALRFPHQQWGASGLISNASFSRSGVPLMFSKAVCFHIVLGRHELFIFSHLACWAPASGLSPFPVRDVSAGRWWWWLHWARGPPMPSATFELVFWGVRGTSIT